MLARKGGPGLAIDNHCAVAFAGDGYRVISAAPGAGAYALMAHRGRVTERRLPAAQEYRPASSLFVSLRL